MRLLPLLALLLIPLPALAILNDPGNGNTSPPADDPGWANVGMLDNLNVTYLGYGWVATAYHVGIESGEPVMLDGEPYPIVPETRVVIPHDANDIADLHVFRIDPYPEHLPVLPILERIDDEPPPLGTPVIMIGKGSDRGAQLFDGEEPIGWAYSGTSQKRWGTNTIGGILPGKTKPSVSVARRIANTRTQVLVTEFDANVPSPPSFECMATLGDSGSALFIERDGIWHLAGIQIAISGQVGKALYGHDTLSVDLGFYRDQVLDIVRPCADGRDNDGDGLFDMDDPECGWEGDVSEAFECADGVDNDFDGYIDEGADSDCTSATDDLEAPDQDGDGVLDHEDNCIRHANPTQRDTDIDGFGNICDADFTNDGNVSLNDYFMLSRAIFTWRGHPAYDKHVDLDGDGAIDLGDFLGLSAAFGGPPGPSALDCAGTVPCR